MSDDKPDLITLFAEALERTDPAERAAYLDAHCGDDVELRRRVEALLEAHDGAGRFLEPVETGVFSSKADDSPETIRESVATVVESPGHGTANFVSETEVATIGHEPGVGRTAGFVVGQVIAERYKLLEILGEGGMGTVYRADQTAPVKRQVALKVIKIGMDSRVVLARFDAERQALALMDHPNIARVFDGGTTETGQPFFVMELVIGEPITGYCDRKRLSVNARLELFVAVCKAVQHAHQKGIIHRDLKPGNVMVTEVDGRPTPKVIDFGVAKATEYSLTSETFGDTGAIVGTPTYMSPEQADPSTQDIDTRSDVYSLGVILYELLAGSPPIEAAQFRRGAILEMLRMVREAEPPKPSTKVSTAEALPNIAANRAIDPAELKRELQGDLDWIVMKALERDRSRRYDTANGFATDILRHLAHEPVLAAPPSRLYRFRKFVRKNRGAVIAASLVLLALLAGIAGTTWGLIRADQRRAEAEAARAEEAKRVVERDEERRKAQAGFVLACDVVDGLLKRVGESPGFVARGLGIVDMAISARTWVSNDPRDATNGQDQLRKDLLLQARDFYEKVLRESGDTPRLKAEHAQICLRLAQIFVWLYDFPEAVAHSRKAQILLREMTLEEQNAPDNQELLARSYSVAGLSHWWMSNFPEAHSDLDSAASIYAQLTRDHPEVHDYAARECTVLNQLGRQANRFPARRSKALASLERCLAISQKLAAQYPDRPEFRYQEAKALRTLGDIAEYDKKFDIAGEKFASSMEILGDLLRRFPAVIEYKVLFAQGYVNLLLHATNSGNPAQARIEHEKLRPLVARLYAEYPGVPALRECLAKGDSSLAIALSTLGEHAEATVFAEKAINLSPASGNVMFGCACAYSIGSDAVKRDASLKPADQLERRKSYQDRAKQLLRKAREAGLFRDPLFIDQMTKFSDFEPMRGDTEFDQFLDELNRSRKAFP